MESIKIKGKDYIQVNERIKYFRENYPDGSIITSIESILEGVVIFKAQIFNGDKLVATGHAYEKENSTFINKTSYIENCETSAVGRALGILGIGIDTSLASAEEVQNAVLNQEPDYKPEDVKKWADKLESLDDDEKLKEWKKLGPNLRELLREYSEKSSKK